MSLSPARMRLRTILVLIALVSSVPLVLFAGWLLFSSWQEQRVVIDRQNINTARAISLVVDKEVESTAAALNALASIHALDETELQPFSEVATRLVARQPRWRAILLTDPNGSVLFDTAADPGAEVRAVNPDWVRRVVTTQRLVVSDLFEEGSTGRFFIMIGVPVIRANTVRSILAAQIGSEALSDILRRQNPPANGVVTLLDGTRRIMARTRNEDEYVGKPPTVGFQAAAAHMTEGSWREVLLEGTPAYAALNRSRLTGWTLGLGLPSEPIDAPMRESFWALAGVGILILALAVGSALLLGQIVAGALGSASMAAKALAKGDPVDAPPSHVSEVNELSVGLREAAVILETRLRERDQAEREREHASAERERALVAEQAARSLSEQNEVRLAVTLSSIGDGVIAADATGKVTMVNRVAEGLTGWPEATAVGQPIETVFHIINEQSRMPVESPVSLVFREGRTVGLANHTILVARDGREVPIEDSAAPIRAGDGSLLGVVLVFRDATEKRESERRRAALFEQEQAARLRAEELSRGKDEFVATISHELRNPLGAILGWVQLLRQGTLDTETREHALEVIDRNTRAQTRLIEDLLDMSRVVRGQLRIEMRAVSLTAVATAAIDSVRPTAEVKDLTITLDVGSDVAAISGDPDRLQQILWNLLTNSIKFTPKGGRVGLRIFAEGSEAVVEVSDTGAGIAPDLLPHVFERFTQGAASISRGHGGLGIGLALVRHLVELHGGTVTAESEGENRGATFAVRLPMLGRRALMTGSKAAADQRDGGRLLDQLHVVVVDDDPDVRDLVSMALRQAGAQVTPAGSAHDALDVLESIKPDVVVSDIAMPQVNGYELLKEIRAIPVHSNLPVVALTAYSRVEDRERALEAGFDFHISKPVEPLALVQIIAAAVGRQVDGEDAAGLASAD